MRSRHFLIATLKETPADAEIISHQLMLRAGMIRKVAAGVYNWLPLGLRVLKKVEAVVREEMQAAGAQEVLLPAVQPAELWQKSGRWQQYGGELLRLSDRHQRDFCFGPTHEEVITTLIGNEIRSYKQLPAHFFQIQTKFRDERRPRFGVMRAREFLMKDSYSFHLDQACLEETYQQMYDTYSRIFTRLGLSFRPVEADTGSIGGSSSHEFHVLADSGEDAIAVCDKYDYAANVELAPALAIGGDRPEPAEALEKIATPNQKTIAAISGFLSVSPEKTIKTLIVKGSDTEAVALVLRGDHELNEIKAQKHPMVAEPLQWLDENRIRNIVGCGLGSIGVVGLDIPVIADLSAANLSDFVCGANTDDVHYRGVNWSRDCPQPQVFDLRTVHEGDLCVHANGTTEADRLLIKRGIEVGHIFQLGTKYSDKLGATYLDNQGKAVSMTMGTYGVGVSRIIAAAIEQNHDDRGILWPEPMAPFQIVITPVGYHKSDTVKEVADKLYHQLLDSGYDVLLDDRNERPGILFADADLMGIPHRLVIGEKSLADGNVEYKHRLASASDSVNLEKITRLLEQKLSS